MRTLRVVRDPRLNGVFDGAGEVALLPAEPLDGLESQRLLQLVGERHTDAPHVHHPRERSCPRVARVMYSTNKRTVEPFLATSLVGRFVQGLSASSPLTHLNIAYPHNTI